MDAATHIDDDLIERVQRRLASLDQPTSVDAVRTIREQAGVISDEQLIIALRKLRSDSVGAGPLEAVLALPGVTDVLVNGVDGVWMDSGSGLVRAPLNFDTEDSVRRLATRLALACGNRLD